MLENNADNDKREPNDNRVDDHRPDIEAKAFLRPRSNTGYKYTNQFDELTRRYTIKYLKAA
jgi:hypothetical protein